MARAVLVAAGVVGMASVARAGQWTTVASTNVTREYPGLALLPEGRVLAVTGHPLGGKSLDSAEIYDIARDRWTPTGSLSVPRNGVGPGGLIVLADGSVLIAGGGSANRSVHEVELYDQRSGKWKRAASMRLPRCVHTVTPLESGDVLVAGGIDWLTIHVQDTSEIYDAAQNRWVRLETMHTPRFNHAAVKLPDGNVLVTGGNRAYPGEVVADAEIYDAKTHKWRKTAPMRIARRSHRMALLDDGRVLVVGGAAGENTPNRHLDSVEVFDPKTERWSDAAPLREGRWGPTVDVLRDGRVLVAGGAFAPIGARKSTELFDPATGAWSDAGDLAQARNGHRSIMLPDGRVLIVGGHFVGLYLSSCEIYDPK
ncbi:MAG: kelch-like protein [Planctomycetota bacterium]|nr:MAG: kelch-like protein [Planctomycetota bacterium]